MSGIGSGFVPKPIEALALVAVVGGALLAESRAEGWAFAAAATAIGSVVASIFFELFPRVMVSSTNSAYNLTVANSASPSYTLKVMTVVAVIFFPGPPLPGMEPLYLPQTHQRRASLRGRRSCGARCPARGPETVPDNGGRRIAVTATFGGERDSSPGRAATRGGAIAARSRGESPDEGEDFGDREP